MTATRDPDRLFEAFLDEGPDVRDVVSGRVAVRRLGHERRLSLFTAARIGPGANEGAR